ncbi:hypothetical protein N8I77_012189 [Diaporthe amygdali]|uniref:BTB domain-containing protein n=1 Tax=Phomopsis amygdali TaxID=1214568 RepID=A0AAD9S787_PHOAM|nr:hypothetical protein N8I77_012189 [Diaporthe amygdali]
MSLWDNPQGTGTNESDQNVIEIDSDGDLTLIVGRTKTRFLVCSKALSRSAAFWKCCLYGKFKEAKPAHGLEWVVELPEDNPSGLGCVLLLVHGLGHNLPKINLELAFKITVITNKYDMTRFLWAVAASWLETLKPHLPDEGSDDTIVPQVQWLWVTKELGDAQEHSETLLDLSQMVSTTSDSKAHVLLRPHSPDDKATLTRDTLRCYDAERNVMLAVVDKSYSSNYQRH